MKKYKNADEAWAASARYMRYAEISLMVVVCLQVVRLVVLVVEIASR